MALEIGDVVLCTVEHIVGTNVFVTLDSGEEGVIVFSEVAPGRIRNIREYVVPKKRIACKVIRLSQGRIDLSLRRVTQKEQKEIKESYNKEKSYESIIKGILGSKAQEAIDKISKLGGTYIFLNSAKDNPKELESIVGKEDAKKIIEIISSQQKKKRTEIKREFSLTFTDSEGLQQIKKILSKIENADIRYLSGGKYSIKVESEDAKKADNQLTLILESVEKEVKKCGGEFSIIKK